jgi:hypothetical protein
MNGPWHAGWSGVALGVMAGWRAWAEHRNLWAAVAAVGGIWLRRLRRTQ